MFETNKLLESNNFRTAVLAALITGLLYYLGVILAINFVNPTEKIAFFWPSNAIAAAVLIFMPRRFWPMTLIAVAVAYLSARVPGGTLPPSVLAGFCIANLVECAVVAAVFRSAWRGDLHFANLHRFIPFALIASTCASVISGLIGAATITYILQSATFMRAFVVWFTGDLFGLVLVLPILLAFLVPAEGARSKASMPRTLTGMPVVAGGLIAVGAGLYFGLPEGWDFWLFVPYLLLIALAWVAQKVTLFWTIIGAFGAGVFEVVATFVGFGLFRLEGMSVTEEVVLMKVSIALITMAILLMAAWSESARAEAAEDAA